MAFDGASYFPREWRLALTGELQTYLDQADEAILKAADRAVFEVTSATKERLRDMVRGAGLGHRLANTVRAETYPKQGLARNPAGWIYVQRGAVKIFQAFEVGETIRSQDGGKLAIPIPGSPADRKNFGEQRPGETIIETFRSRGIRLVFVRGNGRRPDMLVAESARVRGTKTGRQRVSNAARTKSGGFAHGAASIPLFWLVPAAKMPKRLDWDAEFRRASSEFMSAFAKEFARWLEILYRQGRA
jgi:hypothetical protein